MQKVTEATEYLSEALGTRVTGLFDKIEVPNLSVNGYRLKEMVEYNPDPLDSPTSLMVGMKIPPMYDPDFPPRELVNRIAESIERLKDEDSELKGFALVFMDDYIDLYATDKEDDALQEKGRVDTTPEIHYNPSGKAVQVVTYCVHNLAFRARSVYGLTSKGEYTEWHEDPEHGNWIQAEVVSKSRLEELDEHNPHTIPMAKVLGSNEKTVRKILAKKKREAKHIINAKPSR